MIFVAWVVRHSTCARSPPEPSTCTTSAGLQPWDLAAGALVAQEAGALVTGLRGQAAQEAMTVAGPPGRVEELRAFLEALDADSDG